MPPRAERVKKGPVSVKVPRRYHHGDLRAALVSAGLVLVREGGLSALTLRGVARAAGVSEAAPYRHFTNRAALILAVAEDGFRRLRIEMIDAATAPLPEGSTSRAALQAIGLAYVRFGISHPAEYRVMFGTEVAGVPPSELPTSYVAESRGTLDLLRMGIARLQMQGSVKAGDVSAMATCAWATMHGLVMLVLDGQVDAGTSDFDSLTRTATLLLMHGMAAE